MSGSGLRSPRHTFATSHLFRSLNPIFAAPIRPGETIVGFRLELEAYLAQAVKLPWAPPIDYEVGVWAVPLSAYPDYFKDLVVGDVEDSAEWFPHLQGGGEVQTGVNTQGPGRQQATQYENRPWAGEIAIAGAGEPADIESAYVAWVSTGTYQIARDYYEMEMGTNAPGGNLQRGDFDLYDQPPQLGKLIRGPIASAVPTQLDADKMSNAVTTGFADSLSQWAERLSLMTQTNRTYKEYLEGWGIDPSRVQGMPEPLLLQRRRLTGTRAGFAMADSRRLAGGIASADRFGINITADPSGGTDMIEVDSGGLGLLGVDIDVTRKRRWTAVEPTVLIGTVCWWPYSFAENQGGHHMDMARMVNASMWGDPAGGMSETDFITAQRLMKIDGLTAMTDEDGKLGPFAMNMLNLFMHGGDFCNQPAQFEYITPFKSGTSGGISSSPNFVVNTLGKFSYSAATDLVR